MSDAKHTPGPWFYSVYSGTTRPATLYAGHDGDEVDIADFGGDWVEEFDDEMIANAHLIAAAPDMLRALEYIVAWGPQDWSPEEARDLANAAIAKARGEVPA